MLVSTKSSSEKQTEREWVCFLIGACLGVDRNH